MLTEAELVAIAANRRPIAVDDRTALFEDQSILYDLVFNDIDPDNDRLTITSINVPSNVNALVTIENNFIRITPKPDWSGNFSFSYTISDGKRGFSSADVAIEVRSVNDAPVTGDAAVSLNEDSPRVFTLADFPFSDPSDLNSLAAVVFCALPARGVLTLDGVAVVPDAPISAADIAAGKLVYTPFANLNGVDNLSFKVIDDGGTENGGVNTSAAATLTLNVTPVVDPPIAVNDHSTTPTRRSGRGFGR